MSESRWLIAVLAVVTVFLASAAAQDEKNEVAGILGRTFIATQPIQGASFFDPNIRFGRGLTVEASYARRVILKEIYSVSGEVPVLFNPDEDLHAGGSSLVPKDYSALFVAPGVRVNVFPTTGVSPWASIGVGFGHISQNGATLYGGTNTGKSTTMAVLQYGVGLDVRIMRRLFIRGEGRDYWAGEPDFPQAPTGKSRQHNYFVGGGVFWRF
jgi:hypothetical protein